MDENLSSAVPSISDDLVGSINSCVDGEYILVQELQAVVLDKRVVGTNRRPADADDVGNACRINDISRRRCIRSNEDVRWHYQYCTIPFAVPPH